MDFSTVGILLLLGAVIYLWLTVNRLSQTVRILEQRPAPPPVPVAAPPPLLASPPVASALDNNLVAVIAAAVSVVLKRPHRIVAVQPDAETQHAWSTEGRREIYLSHKIR